MNSKTVKKPGKLNLAVICILLVLGLGVNIACAAFRSTLDQFMGSRAELSDELLQAGNTLAEQIQAEGTVLLRNEESVLPLSKDINKVNVFGWSATQWITGGSGSGQCATLEVDFLAALKEAGVEYNQELIDMYTDFLDNRPFTGPSGGALSTFPEEFSSLYEPSISNTSCYSQTLLDNAKAFSDTAIRCLAVRQARATTLPGNSTNRMSRAATWWRMTAAPTWKSPPRKKSCSEYVGENYSNVIVLINTTNTTHLSFLETIPGLDACLLVGGTGALGARSVVDILYGDVNPSGHLTDTYAYDFTTGASYANAGMAGIGYYTNADGLYPADGVTTNGNDTGKPSYPALPMWIMWKASMSATSGTRPQIPKATGPIVSNEFGTGYDGVVQYPFGYGMSYTTFDWEVTDSTSGALSKDGTVSVTVKVTNTGEVAGKDVVQLYANPPYYKGQIEKASVNLIDFAKTELLQPGESQEVTLEASVESLASYDCYDDQWQRLCRGGELDQGDYTSTSFPQCP